VKVVFNPFTGTLDYVATVAGVTEPVTDSIETENGARLTTEAGDYLVPET